MYYEETELKTTFTNAACNLAQSIFQLIDKDPT